MVLLIAANLATLGALGYLAFRPPAQPRPDPLVARALRGLPPPTASATGTRRVISVEILNRSSWPAPVAGWPASPARWRRA